jgi:hypothetical protein
MSSKNLRRRMEVMLVEGICALDVAEALLSVDAAAVEQRSVPPDVDVLGVRQAGRTTGYVHLPLDKESGVKPISPEQIVPQTAGLAEVIRVLGDFTCCFVEVLGEVAGLVTREDMEKPPVRMWLFGILTIVETYCSRKLEAFFPDRSWTEHVSPNRLEKAEALQAERKRRGRFDAAGPGDVRLPRLVRCRGRWLRTRLDAFRRAQRTQPRPLHDRPLAGYERDVQGRKICHNLQTQRRQHRLLV